MYRSNSKYGFYTPLTAIDWIEGTSIDTTYTDTTVVADTIYWYRVQWVDADDNKYPMTSPQQPRSYGFIDNQEYQVVISSEIQTTDGATTPSADITLGENYVFYFTTRLYPMYGNIQQLEIILGPKGLEGFTTIELYASMLYNSLSAYKFNAVDTIPDKSYTLDQFSDISVAMATYAQFFACYVHNKSAYDLLLVKELSGWTSGSVRIGDFSYTNDGAKRNSLDPRLTTLLDKATECYIQFSDHVYDDVFTWTRKASEYYYAPYGPGETRSWWSDKQYQPWRLRGY